MIVFVCLFVYCKQIMSETYSRCNTFPVLFQTATKRSCARCVWLVRLVWLPGVDIAACASPVLTGSSQSLAHVLYVDRESRSFHVLDGCGAANGAQTNDHIGLRPDTFR